MFIEINGHLVNADQLVQVTPQGAVELTSGSAINCADKAEVAALRETLKPSAVEVAPAPPAAPKPEPLKDEKTK